MQLFRQKIKTRLTFGGLYCALVLVLVGILRTFGLEENNLDFTIGFAAGIEAIVIYYMMQSIAALKSEEKLKKLYIEENDERNKLIKEKVGGSVINFVLLSLSLAMLISGFFNKIVFFTLLATVLYITVVMLVLKIYYNKKL